MMGMWWRRCIIYYCFCGGAWLVSQALVVFPTQSRRSRRSTITSTRNPGRVRGLPILRRPDDTATVLQASTAVIRADEKDFEFDGGLGGVRLAQESALCLTGSWNEAHSSLAQQEEEAGSAVQWDSLTRYTQLRPLSTEQVQTWLSQVGATLLLEATGRELYQDPGDTQVTKVVHTAPMAAIQQALASSSSSSSSTTPPPPPPSHVVCNMLGGNDLQVLEVTEALAYYWAQQPPAASGSSNRRSITCHSLSHASIPLGSATLTMVAWANPPSEAAAASEVSSSDDPAKSLQRAVQQGLVFGSADQYWTVVEEDINPDLA